MSGSSAGEMYGATTGDNGEAKVDEESDQMKSRSINFPLGDFESKQVAVRTCMDHTRAQLRNNVPAVLPQWY